MTNEELIAMYSARLKFVKTRIRAHNIGLGHWYGDVKWLESRIRELERIKKLAGPERAFQSAGMDEALKVRRGR